MCASGGRESEAKTDDVLCHSMQRFIPLTYSRQVASDYLVIANVPEQLLGRRARCLGNNGGAMDSPWL